MGRVDDIIICAGHNLSTGSIEESLAGHPDVAECAVFGVKDALKTQVPLGVVVLKRTIANGEAYQMPATIDDPAVLEEIRVALVQLGYAREMATAIGGG